jgi:hypothetical protein
MPMRMDDEASVGRSPEFAASRDQGIDRAIEAAGTAYALGSSVALAQIYGQFARDGAAKLAHLLSESPALMLAEGGWALGAARAARAEIAAALAQVDQLLADHAEQEAPAWDEAQRGEAFHRHKVVELNRELLEVLRIDDYALRYIGADDQQRAWLVQQAALDIAKRFLGHHPTRDDYHRALKASGDLINRAPPRIVPSPTPAPLASSRYDDGFDDDGYD